MSNEDNTDNTKGILIFEWDKPKGSVRKMYRADVKPSLINKKIDELWSKYDDKFYDARVYYVYREEGELIFNTVVNSIAYYNLSNHIHLNELMTIFETILVLNKTVEHLHTTECKEFDVKVKFDTMNMLVNLVLKLYRRSFIDVRVTEETLNKGHIKTPIEMYEYLKNFYSKLLKYKVKMYTLHG